MVELMQRAGDAIAEARIVLARPKVRVAAIGNVVQWQLGPLAVRLPRLIARRVGEILARS